MTASLGYFDTYRRERLPANLVQVRAVCWTALRCPAPPRRALVTPAPRSLFFLHLTLRPHSDVTSHTHPQAQRDFFGSHTYQRTDKEGWFHTVWDENFGSADSITTSGYTA